MADALPVEGACACVCRGTLIATPRGAVAIENLVVGEDILTAAGKSRPVRWVGHRALDCSRHPDPTVVWPICIRDGAIAENVPSKDLWISPGHRIFLEGVLIPAAKLLNGVTVFQVHPQRVEYWHLELDAHDIVLAQELPAESLLDTGFRTTFFAASGTSEEVPTPDPAPDPSGNACAPVVTDGPKLQAVRAALLERAQVIGHTMTDDPGLYVLADDQRVEPLRLTDRRVSFTLPIAAHIELRCRSFEPRHTVPESNDSRRLGVMVNRLQLDGTDVALANYEVLSTGWYTYEADGSGTQWRWSSDRGRLPSGTRLVVLDYTPGRYWS